MSAILAIFMVPLFSVPTLAVMSIIEQSYQTRPERVGCGLMNPDDSQHRKWTGSPTFVTPASAGHSIAAGHLSGRWMPVDVSPSSPTRSGQSLGAHAAQSDDEATGHVPSQRP